MQLYATSANADKGPKPNFVSIFFNGRIVKTGGPEVALMLEERGYGWVEQEFGAEAAVAA